LKASENNERLLALNAEDDELLQEMQRRNDARSSLAEYGRYLNPYCEFPDFQLEMIDVLEKVERGEIKRLIINMPPRFGKSFWASMYFPAWFISRNPRKKIIHASYSASIAIDFGREIRNILKSDESAQLFDVRLRQDSKSASRFHATNGCHYYAVGARGSITGRGCHLGIIEDPINANDADNKNVLLKCYNWFKGTFRSRLEPNAAIVIIQQRLNPDDLSGKLIDEMRCGGETWTVLTIPAIGKDGESNFPGRWPLEALGEIQKSVGPKIWQAQYMQDPRAGDGDMFKSEWFNEKYVEPDEVPAGIRVVRAWDRAATEVKPGKDPDYSAGVKIGRAKDGRVYVLHVMRFRKTPLQNELITESTAAMDGIRVTILQEEEGGSSGKTTTSHYHRNVIPGYKFRGIKSTGSKTERADPLSGQCEAGNVFIVRGEWNADFMSELCGFPGGKHDDQVDAAAIGYNYLAEKPNILDKLGKR
jgi:predicted phage terminase large subunit-like protein